MAAFLSASAKTTLDWVVSYLTPAQTDKPLDEKAVDELSKHHVAFGYDSEVKFREDMRDLPIVTLLNVILYLNAHA